MNKLTRSFNSLSSIYYTLVPNKYQADLLNCYRRSYKTVSTLLLGAGIKNYFNHMEIHNDEVLNTEEQIVLLILQLLYYN